MKVDALKYRTDDNMDIIIVVELYDHYNNFIWKIDDIKYKTSKQKTYRSLSAPIFNDYSYRLLSIRERYKYLLDKFIEFVGKDKIIEAFNAAYEQIKPDFEKVLKGDVYDI